MPHLSIKDLLYLKSINVEETSREEKKQTLKAQQLPAYWWVASAPQLEILLSDCFSRGINELMCLGVKILGAVSLRLIILILQNRAFAMKKKTFAHNADTRTHTHARGIARSLTA